MALSEQKSGETPKSNIFDRYPQLREVREKNRFPQNVFIIPDGHSRWASLRDLPVTLGHIKGAQVMIDAFEELSELGEYIPYVGAWGFSVDNTSRSKKEVDFLMKIFDRTLKQLQADFMERNNRFVHLGRKDILFQYESLNSTIIKTEEMTSKNTGQTVYIGIAFGGEDQDIRIDEKLIEMARKDSELKASKSLRESLRDGFGKIPSADLIIRSSGEQRLSDLGWIHGKGTELYFTEKLLPDFEGKDFIDAIVDFSKRERRFGGRPKTN